MQNIYELLTQIDELPDTEKWQIVRHVLNKLEHTPAIQKDRSDWHQFLRETYGSLKDSPIQRWDQGEYEDRETFE
jgi:hypothetical protein